MRINYLKPCDGSPASYDPVTEGYYITAFKPGIKHNDTYIPPLPSNTMLSLAHGWVGKPQRSFELAMRDLCQVHVRFPTIAHIVEICKCPVAFAQRDSFVAITDVPDPAILALARTVDWSWWMDREAFEKGEGKYALKKA